MNSSPEESGKEDAQWTLSQIVLLLRYQPLRLIGTAIVTLVAGILWMGVQTPGYVATSTLLIGSSKSSSPLGDLMGGGNSDVDGEMVVVRSAMVAEATIDPPPSLLPENGVPDPYNQGLTTLIDDTRYRPVDSILNRITRRNVAGRVWGHVDPPVSEFRIEFTTPNRLRVLRAAGFGRSPVVTEYAFTPREPILLPDTILTLATDGDVTGRTFMIRSMTKADALTNLRSRLRVAQRGLGSGAVAITVEDSDPRRAAETANAVARNYLEASERREEARSSRTTSFIESTLTEHRAELIEAEAELIELQTKYPNTINTQGTVGSLMIQSRELETEKMRLSVIEQSFLEALELMRDGDYVALSRISPEFLDSVSHRYVHHITDLSTEALLQNRSDSGSYRYMLQSRISQLRSELDQIRMWRESLLQIIRLVTSGDRSALSQLATQGPNSMPMDPMTSVLLNELGRLKVEHDKVITTFTDRHPEVIEIENTISEVEQQTVDHLRSRTEGFDNTIQEYERLIASREETLDTYPLRERAAIDEAIAKLQRLTENHIRGRLVGVANQRERIERELARVDRIREELPAENQKISEPMRRYQAAQTMVAFLTKSMHESTIQRTVSQGYSEIIDPAVAPNNRSKPRTFVLMVFFLILGVVLGTLHAAMWEKSHGGVRSKEALAITSNLPVVGEISFAQLTGWTDAADPTFLPLRDDPDGDSAEAYRMIRATLDATRTDRSRRYVLAVTSVTRGEGGTTCSLEIARAFHRAGERVLIIDGDLREPTAHTYLHLSPAPGFADLLAGQHSWRDLVQPTDEPDLDFIPGGSAPTGVADLLARGDVRGPLEQMGQSYDVILIDVPPILKYSDASQIAPFVDVMLLLVRQGRSSCDQVREAGRRVRNSGVPWYGSLLLADGEQRWSPLKKRHHEFAPV